MENICVSNENKDSGSNENKESGSNKNKECVSNESTESIITPTEDGEDEVSEKLWVEKPPLAIPNVLDPDDALMKRFQDALHAHLNRIDNRLAEEIIDLEAEIKAVEKEHESESRQLYCAQQEIIQQQQTIEKYESTIGKILSLREEKDKQVEIAKQQHKESYQKLLKEKETEKNLAHDLESLSAIKRQLNEWETQLNDVLMLSKRMAGGDLIQQQKLINEKNQKDYILLKLVEEIGKIENEIAYLDEQIQVKDKERATIGQLAADANADLEALHREHSTLCTAWNSVVINIYKQDKVYNELREERENLRDEFNLIQAEIEKLKKDTRKEMESNEQMMAVHMRMENENKIVSKTIATFADTLHSLEDEMIKCAKLGDHVKAEYDASRADIQHYNSKEEEVEKELAKLKNMKNDLEDMVYAKLAEKVAQDKTAKHLNKVLMSEKDLIQEQEFMVTQAENTYGKNLLEIERMNAIVTSERQELQEIVEKNAADEKKIEEVQRDIKKCESTIESRQRKIMSLHKALEKSRENNNGAEEVNPQDLKIMSLEKNIQDVEQNTQKAQQYWLRQESYMVTVSQQRDAQLQQLQFRAKEIMIMEQKNLKIEYELEKFSKEEANMKRKANLLQQKLSQINACVVTQNQLKEGLEDKNVVTKNEYLQSLQEDELKLIQLQSEIKELKEEKKSLQNELLAVQQESLAWEKKVQLMQETAKRMKDERSTSGDINLMKSEIHKMEMRLVHLRRVQEKLVNDMEYCITRRDSIVDKALGRLMKNPKEQHNQKTVFFKRIEDQKAKMRQIAKDVKQTEGKIFELDNKCAEMSNKVQESKRDLQNNEDALIPIDQEIRDLELTKYQNLQALVYKQRKVKLYQDIANRKYKMLCKNEALLDEEMKKEQERRANLINIMEQTKEDFPHLQNDMRKIFVTLQLS